jgi:hypothetical protein
MGYPHGNTPEREPGKDDDKDATGEARRIEHDARSNKGLGGIIQPQKDSETKDALERAARKK